LELSVDLAGQTLTLDDGTRIAFELDPGNKRRLIEGLDDIGLTLQQADAIRAYEARRHAEAPWLFAAD
jgi:3-isopropylmalate/(R)-2-methylmalate dehydratase small subunit